MIFFIPFCQSIFYLVSFSFYQRASFNIFKYFQLLVKYFSFYLKKIFKSCSHLFSKLKAFSFSTLNIFLLYLLSFIFFWHEVSVFIIIFLIRCNMSFFLHLLFTFFSTSLTWSKLTFMYLLCSVPHAFFPPLLGLAKLLEWMVLQFWTKMKKISYYFFKYFSISTFSQDYIYISVVIILISNRSLIYIIFFQFHFFLHFTVEFFYYCVFLFTNLLLLLSSVFFLIQTYIFYF